MKIFSLSLFVTLSTTPLFAQLVASKDYPKINIPKNHTLTQFADRTKVVTPTTLCIDDQGKVFISETFRWRKQVQDIRHGGKNNRYLRERIEDDIKTMELSQRLKVHQKWSGKEPDYLNFEEFDDDSETIKTMEDTDGDGIADRFGMFRSDFNQPLDGPSSGLIEKDGTVYFAMIPGIYSLRDNDGDGVAEERKTLVDGFGVRISFSGHDLNGFAFGPDGKLYWSIGDRGYDVEHEGKRYSQPDAGAIFRANPDGSDFEVFCTNLRNPKEIVFDEHGNLFTVDNDYDNGDNERIVYLVEHGNSGWKMGHQTIVSFSNTIFNHVGPKPSKREEQIDIWMNEGLWRTRHEDQPAYIIPPVALTVNGPCGLAYNPGVTGLTKEFDQHFFVVSYVAGPAGCGINGFTLKPDGASFKLDKHDWFLKGIAATDLDFAPDGRLYISDYGGGWGRSENGGVYHIANKQRLKDPAVLEVKALFAQGFPKMESSKLFELMAHPDQRVRTRAQFALAERGTQSLGLFKKALHQKQPLLRRLHGLWGLGQLAQKDPALLQHLKGLAQDSELEVRANLARTLGSHAQHLGSFQSELISLLKDKSARVASLAALALANQADSAAIEPAIDLLIRNADHDAIVRHGGIMILAEAADEKFLASLHQHESIAVRRAATVALRRQRSIYLEAFFDDPDRLVRHEAIRAAYDENIVETFPALSERANAIAKEVTSEVTYHPMTARRALHAAWTLARPQDLDVLTGLINNKSIDQRIQRDAFVALLEWNNPPVPDLVTGFARTLPKTRLPLPGNLLEKLTPFFDQPQPALLTKALTLVEQERLPLSSKHLLNYLISDQLPAQARLKALNLLAPSQEGDSSWKATLEALVKDKNDQIRSRSRELLLQLNPDEASIKLLAQTLTNQQATSTEKQLTIRTLGRLNHPTASQIITDSLEKLTSRKLDLSIGLDVVLAAEGSSDKAVQAALVNFRNSLPKDDPTAEWKLLCETGGDIKLGKTLVYSHATAQCQRCHSIHGIGGNVGPELGAIGKLRDPSYLVRALVTPGSEVAEGYGLGSITLTDGTVISGTLMPDDAQGNARLMIGEAIKTISKAQIQERSTPISGMPPMTGLLTRQEARDIIAYLVANKEDRTDEGHK